MTLLRTKNGMMGFVTFKLNLTRMCIFLKPTPKYMQICFFIQHTTITRIKCDHMYFVSHKSYFIFKVYIKRILQIGRSRISIKVHNYRNYKPASPLTTRLSKYRLSKEERKEKQVQKQQHRGAKQLSVTPNPGFHQPQVAAGKTGRQGGTTGPRHGGVRGRGSVH